ncbi:hypothetical protein E2P84_20460 [Burkholderia cepacia]|uniref:Uncharacterized protein n=1 Tax=Burkholderia cepacia TaxID=292 RepID=A0AAX2RJ96_BURCE|nr:hypothetical protein [Burkholderia cepacia]TES73980.1 hypothetical protein E2P84_20460 [Burkholderia cepacia]TET05346.1 hypothetical protein E3D36_00095 [Burkholderia cepacia]TEU40319.1 hypothetical protein E3D37_28875 [Burkholderia cepacia]TEU42420.1 hypothetical protein E3D39_15795 [Burkholderia cepacia]TEU57455.1 hypothetical protein E3D38_03240 [Burkholderia cepacia]
MRIASNNLQSVIHKNKRSLVLVGATDNELLAACGEIHGYIVKGSLWAVGSGLTVACVWFLCVAFRAGVLSWSF